jgi:mannobiose 2-epimerase
LRKQLESQIMPYWHDTAIDREFGGYVLSDDAVKGRTFSNEKMIVTQSRLIWGFSHAWVHGIRDSKRDYCAAAKQGYRFVMDHFLDREYGGYVWLTDRQGSIRNDRKILYGQAFVIYGLVEYYRASKDESALRTALDLHHLLRKKARDEHYGGWFEHFRKNWTPILTPERGANVEVPGLKSSNAHMHMMEAFSELYDVTRDADVQCSLEELIRINRDIFYPMDLAQSNSRRHRDWQKVKNDPESNAYSFGHNVEAAWVLIRAERVLGREPTWKHLDAHLKHALQFGFDHRFGGLLTKGISNARDTRKIWWVQAEMLTALSWALQHRPDREHEDALEKLLNFLLTYMADPRDGIWLDTVATDGRPIRTGKAHMWKANYHDVRAIVKFLEVISNSPQTSEHWYFDRSS